MQSFAIRFAPAFLLTTLAFAQGSDDCSTAQAIAGAGTFAVSTVGATNGLPDAPGCVNTNIDVWFLWTSASTGMVEVNTCGGVAVDTVITVWADNAGACPVTMVGCNDDSCGLQSRVTFAATTGTSYFLQLGAFNGTATYTGSFTVADIPPPAILDTRVNPANGHTYHLTEIASWNAVQSLAVSLGGNLVTVNDQAEHDWIVAQWHNWQGVDIDLWCGFNDVAVEGTYEWISGETPGFTNWDAGEPNNANAGEDYAIIRKNSVNGLWNDVPENPTGFHAGVRGVIEINSTPPTAFCFGDGTLTDHTTPCPCANFGGPGRGCANSVEPNGALLSTTGVVSNDDVVLVGSGMPLSVSCIYLQGTGLDDVAFGDGVRCAGGTLLRLRTKANVGGASSFPDSADTITLSTRGGVTVGSGLRRYYQTYYRNSAALFCPPETFNVTNGITIDW